MPVVLLAPLIGLQYALPNDALWVLVYSLLLGTPTLSLIGAIGAAFFHTVGGTGIVADGQMSHFDEGPLHPFTGASVFATLGEVGGNLHFLGNCFRVLVKQQIE